MLAAWGQPLFGKIFAESGEDSLEIMQKGTNRNQKGSKKAPKVSQKATNIQHQIWLKMCERVTMFWCHFGVTWSILGPILAVAGFPRADPPGVSICIWRKRKN